MIPIHQLQPPPPDSDSDSEDDTLNSYIRKNIQQQTQQLPNNNHSSCKLKIIVTLLFVFSATVSIYYINILSKDQFATPPTDKPDTTNNNIIAGEIERNKINQNNHSQQTVNTNAPAKVQLRDLNVTVQLRNAHFQTKNIKNGATHWYIKRDVRCIPNQIVNSATKLSDHLYIQNTAYENINTAAQSATIPASDIYYLQPPHQFIKNISITQQNITVAFDHHDPLLLVLAIRYFTKGIFASEQYNTPLMEQNLILNDQYLLANFVNRQQIIQKGHFSFLITSDFELGIKLAMEAKNQLMILTNLNEPTVIKTALLLKVKLYKISEGYECHNRTLSILESPNWRIDESAFLLAGWYVITSPSYTINANNQKLNYQEKIIKQSTTTCADLKEFTVKSKQMPNNNIYVTNLPFPGLFFYDSEVVPSQSLQTAFSFLKSQNWEGPVYLDSGSLDMMIVTVAALPKEIAILLYNDYKQRKILNKNLVLNNYQKVKTAAANQTQTIQFELTVTAEQQNILKTNSKNFIFLNSNNQTKLKNYKYSQIIQTDCLFHSLTPTPTQLLSPGIYLVQKQT